MSVHLFDSFGCIRSETTFSDYPKEEKVMSVQINITQQADGQVCPHPNGEGMAIVSYSKAPDGSKVGTVTFAGVPQAVLYFDTLGQCIISYYAYNPMLAPSVENIIRHINQTVH